MLSNRGPASGFSNKKWIYHASDVSKIDALAAGLSIAPLLARLLVNRGIHSVEAARIFLRPTIEHLHDPKSMQGMEKAIGRLTKALYDREKIVVHGDYDVDGVTGTALLTLFFRLQGGEITPFIPHRTKDGYSLQKENLKRFAEEGHKVIITVDCGTSNIEEINYAQELGMDVIVTDHHQPGSELPKPYVLLNPHLDPNYPFKGLTGVGMTLKLALGLAASFSENKMMSPEFKTFLESALGLAAMGTIADVAPLVDENRVLITHGLRAITQSPSAGFRALLEGAGLADKEITATDVAFRLAPMINASGRMGSAETAFELLTSMDLRAARDLENKLSRANAERKETEGWISEEARQQVQQMDLAATHALVLGHATWHPGVIGIVAARMAEEFHRPSVVIAINETEKKGKGSCRSIPGLNIYEAMKECGDIFNSFGGHAQAAGFEIPVENIPILRRRLNAALAENHSTQNMVPELNIDAQVAFSDLTLSLVKEIHRLSPFGAGNPEPVLMSADLKIAGKPRVVGQKNNHLLFYANQGDVSLKAIAFGAAGILPQLMEKGRCHLAYTPNINTWNGKRSVEIDVKDIMI